MYLNLKNEATYFHSVCELCFHQHGNVAIKQLGDAINSEVFFYGVKQTLNGLNSTSRNKICSFLCNKFFRYA